MIRLLPLNDIRVKPIKLEKIDKSRIKGYALFPEIYANIFICARKKSGKSTVIFNILKHCSGKDTRIVIFSSTVNKDPTYTAIDKYFSGKGNTVLKYTSIKEDGVNNLTQIMEMLRGPDEEKEETEDDSDNAPMPVIITDTSKSKHEKKRKPRRPKFVSPELIFVFDDLNIELQDNSLNMLVKSNRHYKCKVIISSQYIHDLRPQSLLQLDYMLLFKGQSEEKLQIIYKRLDLAITFDKFKEYYTLATKKKFNFFYIDKNNEEFRINFNTSITNNKI